MNSPFVKHFDELFDNIKYDIKNENQVSLYIASDKDDSIFEKVLVQQLIRNINHHPVKFIAIRNIDLKKQFRGQKHFTNFVDRLETVPYPVMYHDIVNEKLIPFFDKKGYKIFKEKKYDQEILSMYKITNTIINN